MCHPTNIFRVRSRQDMVTGFVAVGEVSRLSRQENVSNKLLKRLKDFKDIGGRVCRSKSRLLKRRISQSLKSSEV